MAAVYPLKVKYDQDNKSGRFSVANPDFELRGRGRAVLIYLPRWLSSPLSFLFFSTQNQEERESLSGPSLRSATGFLDAFDTIKMRQAFPLKINTL